MNRVIIMRGIPGSGKTTTAEWIMRNQDRDGKFWIEDCIKYFGNKDLVLGTIHSTDEYFMKNGEYRYNPSKIKLNHNKNYKAFKCSVDLKIPLIIVDNTNTTESEWKKYKMYAEQNDYSVSFHVMSTPTASEALSRNTHNVPLDVIKKMIRRFE